MAKFSIKSDLLGGQFLSKDKVSRQWGFILYIFLLILLYITINLGVQKTQLAQSKNLRDLKNLKADYTSKAAKLQNQSSREQIRTKLIENGSTLKNPTHPAHVIEKPKAGI
ncbi:MAG: FtsL-like putative cell division protein [Candidatus Egerieousia sp.]